MEIFNYVKNLKNRRLGWETKRKIIVIESDDWGSIRMPDKETYLNLIENGIRVDMCPYCRFDSLASPDDLDALFSVLSRFKDKNGNNPVITANTIVANPDFEKIRASGFTQYFFESFTTTLQRFPSHENSFLLWKQGISSGIFYPQFHGREHLNVKRWMEALRAGQKETMLAFDNRMFGISLTITSEKRKSYLAALELDDISDLTEKKHILEEGLALFEEIFGYRSLSFIAPNYIWHSEMEDTLYKNGVTIIQGHGRQVQSEGKKSTIIRHPPGSVNKLNQVYIVRNCYFEPALNPRVRWVERCLNDIARAFRLRQPAIITAHRLNFIGFIDPDNRKRNLELFESLLREILKRWPDVEFFRSDKLGKLILSEKEDNIRTC